MSQVHQPSKKYTEQEVHPLKGILTTCRSVDEDAENLPKKVNRLDLCQIILNLNKKLSNFLCGRTQIIIFAACSRECNVFSLG